MGARGPGRPALSIAVKDATETWRDGRFRWAAVLLGLLIVAAVAGGAEHQSSVAAQHRDAQRVERDTWLDKGEMNPHAAAHYGAFVFKPVQPLAALDPGLDPFTGVFVFLEAHKQQLARYRPIEDAAPTRRLGLLTPATGALVLLPLFVVCLTFASVAGEREQGTLRPLLALGIARRDVWVGKALGAMMPVVAVMLPSVAAGAAALWWIAPPGAAVGGRALGLLAVYGAHTLVWVGLGLLVSARARTAQAALATLLALWFASTFVMPPLAMAVAKVVEPSPGPAEFAAAIADEKDRWPTWDERVARVTERFLAGEFDQRSTPANIEVVALVEAEAEETALYQRHFDALFNAHGRQSAVAERLGSLAPTMAARALSMGLAGTDAAHDRHFMDATSRYRSMFLAALNAELSGSGRWNSFDYMRGRDLWEKIPAFDYDAPDTGWALGQHPWSAAALALWCAAALAASGWAVATMRVD